MPKTDTETPITQVMASEKYTAYNTQLPYITNFNLIPLIFERYIDSYFLFCGKKINKEPL